MASRVVTRAAVRCKPLPVRARGSGFGVAACPLRHWVTFLHDTLARASGVTALEYHLLEDFVADWTQAADWEGFYTFFTHCVRDLLLIETPAEELSWAMGAQPTHTWPCW